MNNDFTASSDKSADNQRQAASDVRASREILVSQNRPLTTTLGARAAERGAEPIQDVVREEAKARELPSAAKAIGERIARNPALAYD